MNIEKITKKTKALNLIEIQEEMMPIGKITNVINIEKISKLVFIRNQVTFQYFDILHQSNDILAKFEIKNSTATLTVSLYGAELIFPVLKKIIEENIKEEMK